MKTKAPSLRLLLTNAFSMYNKMDELQHTLKSLHVDIAVVTETKLSPDKASVAEVSIPGYYPPIRRDRTAQGGGVAIWLKEGMAYKQLDINSECETLWISVAAPSGIKFGICAAYRPGTSADSDCSIFTQLESDIDKARQSCSHIIVAGDFNAHNREWLGSPRTSAAGEAAEDMCCVHGLRQHVTSATRGENILDLVMSDVPGAVSTTTQPPLGRSDHAVVIADFQLTASVDQPTTRTVWRYQRADWPRLSAFLRTTDWDTIIGDDPNISCELLTMRITEGMQRFLPSKVFKTRPQDPIWWTPECSAAVDRKRNAWRKFRDDPRNGALQCTYKLASLDSTRCLARAKAKHLDHVKQRLRTGSLQDREWWSVIKRVGGHGRDSSIPVLVDPDGMECTKSHDKANVIGKYFAQKCSLDDDFAEQSGPFPHVRQRTANTLATVHFRQATVRRTLRALNSSKATGPDAVPARVLRKCADSLALPHIQAVYPWTYM